MEEIGSSVIYMHAKLRIAQWTSKDVRSAIEALRYSRFNR